MTILVVDDELNIKELFLQRFRREIRTQIIQFAFTHLAQQALDYLDKQGYSEILILSDINMPGMGGSCYIKCLREKLRPFMKGYNYCIGGSSAL